MASPRTYLVDGAGSGPSGKVTGGDANGLFGAVFDRLQDNALMWATVTSAGSEGDTVTADVNATTTGTPRDDRFLERGWQAGMGLRLVWPAANTGAVTLAVNGGTALSVLTPEGDALAAGQLPQGIVVELVYYDGAFVCVSPLPDAVASAVARYFYKLTVSAIWTKPGGLGDDTAWTVGVWGAGGGGGTDGVSVGSGGGGGAFSQGVFRHADLPSTVSCTIGSGGGVAAAGGNSAFGSLLTGYGGAGGTNNGVAGAGATGGVLGTTFRGGAGAVQATAGVSTYWGGAGGGTSPGGPGTSVFGGDGGANGVAGASRGGGGGRLALGGRGEIWIWN